MKLHHLIIAPLAALAMLSAQAADKLKIGVVPGAYGDSVNAAVAEAKAAGIDVQVIEFTDWTTPNVALQAGDIDVNFFQHQPFLDGVNKKNNFHLAVAAPGILANLGLYSLKHKKVEDIPVGGKAAVADDPVNQGRGLLLLQKVGLIKLKPGVGFTGSINDIVENPKKLSFVEVPGPQLARITGDVDIAEGYPHFIVASKAFDASSGLVYSGVDEKIFNVSFVTKAGRTQDPVVQKFVKVFHNSAAVKAQIRKSFNNDDRLYVLAWTQ